MEAERISDLERILPLVEKYGLSVVLLFLFLLFAYMQWRAVATGKLVPREMLDRALQDNDHLQEILDSERKAFMMPTLEVLQRLKIDHNAVNPENTEDRGG
jgi:Na+-transporting methylmalonyl-CoA/oxaloacetate decarboxylase gamma subunit